MLLLVLQVTGTPLYMAPENLRGCHGMEVDVWAAGVMVSRTNISNCCHEQQQQEIIWLLSLSQCVVASTATSAQVPLAEPHAHPGHDLLLSAVVVSSLLLERQEVFNHPALQGTRTCCSKAMVLPIPYDGCCSNSHASQLFCLTLFATSCCSSISSCQTASLSGTLTCTRSMAWAVQPSARASCTALCCSLCSPGAHQCTAVLRTLS